MLLFVVGPCPFVARLQQRGCAKCPPHTGSSLVICVPEETPRASVGGPRRYRRLESIRPGLCCPLALHYCGKPFPMVFASAQRYLEGCAADAAAAAAAAGADAAERTTPFEAIYMVGGARFHEANVCSHANTTDLT
jgi:hypothetical protein